MRDVLLKNGRVVDPARQLDQVQDVLVKEGKIEAIGSNISVPKDFPIIDVSGLVVTPGWVDMHTHLREPGQSRKETIATGTAAAAAGGFTSIACMANTSPVNDNPYITTFIREKAAREAKVNVHVIGAVTKGLEGKEMAEIGGMREAGICAISDDGKTVMNAYLMRKAMDYSKRFDLTIISHAEDSCLKGRGVMNEGFNSARFGLRGIPKASEEIIVARDILLAELTQTKVHIAHVSSKGSIDIIRSAKDRGVKVTAEVTPHHLWLTDDAVSNYDTNTKVAPPLREQEDTEALTQALKEGVIDVVASDHAPHAVEDKEVEYDVAEFGMVGLETAFSLYYRKVLDNALPLHRLIEAMTTAPAKILGITAGSLVRGADADITVFDPSAEHVVDKRRFFSKSQNTPFDGWKFKGRVRFTLVKGYLVFDSSKGIL